MDNGTESKIGQLQLLEQNLQNIIQQKQIIQSQKLEVENALSEIDKTKGDVYKIVGPVMVKGDKELIKIDLSSKKEMFDLRMKSVDKQEKTIKDKMTGLQEEVVSIMQKQKGGKQ